MSAAAGLLGAGRLRKKVFFDLLVLSTLLFILKATSFVEMVEFDEQQLYLQGRQLVRGHGYYTLFNEARPPLITLAYSAIYKVFGFSPHALRVITALLTVVAILKSHWTVATSAS